MENNTKVKSLFVFILFFIISISGLRAQEIRKDTISTPVFKRSLVSLSLSDVFLKRFAIEYEVIADKKGKLGFSVNYLYDFEKKVFEIYHSNTHWWLGLKIQYFPTGQTRFRFYSGLELKIITLAHFYSIGGDTPREVYKDKARLFILYWMGVRYDVSKHIVFSVNTGFSIQKSSSYFGIDGLFIGNVGLGFKF